MNKLIVEHLKSQQKLSMPLMSTYFASELNLKLGELVAGSRLHSKLLLELIHKYELLAYPTVMDLSLEVEAFGAKVSYSESHIPQVLENLVSSEEDVSRLRVPNVMKGRTKHAINTVIDVCSQTDKLVLAGCIAPFSLAGRLMGAKKLQAEVEKSTPLLLSVLEKCTSFINQLVATYKESGASGVIIADPFAGFLDKDQAKLLSGSYLKSIVDSHQDDSFAVVIHNCGDKGNCTSAAVETGAVALHFGNIISVEEALKPVPSDRLVMGNVDPYGVLKLASPEKVYETTLEILDCAQKYDNFVLSTGCEIPYDAPKENVRAFFEAFQHYTK